MGIYDLEEEEEDVAEYFDYYGSEVEADEFEDECLYQQPRHAYVVKRHASGIPGRVKEHQSTTKGTSVGYPDRTKGMASGIT